jgi:hypothetical protein
MLQVTSSRDSSDPTVSVKRPLLFKSDHPRGIDRFIDYFGEHPTPARVHVMRLRDGD